MKNLSLFSIFLLSFFYASCHSVSTTSNTTLAQIVSNTTLEEEEPVPQKEPKTLNLILSKLKKEQADKCAYGSNPLVSDICESFDSSSLANQRFINVRVEDIVHRVLRAEVIDKLKKDCVPGEWCLSDAHHVTKHPLGKKLITEYADHLCMFAGCYREIKDYIVSCVETELSKNVLNVVPVLCEAVGRENQYCVESAMQMFHVSASMLARATDGKVINLFSSLFQYNSFKPLNWITDYSLENNVETYCDLPITSICWSDGKFYLGISPNIVVLAVVLTTIFTSILCLFVYVCCFNSLRIKKNYYNDSISYSQLNNSVEQDMDLVTSASDSEFYKEKFEFRLVGDREMSRFVNDQKAEYKNLLNF